jgi:2-hydroxy-3-keto-5-methylthiopentenyl-1-phosphate phosphatase
MMADVAGAVFKQTKSKEDNYKKLVYLRESTPPYRWMEARLVKDFVFGSVHLIKYCEQVAKDDKELNFSEFEDFF